MHILVALVGKAHRRELGGDGRSFSIPLCFSVLSSTNNYVCEWHGLYSKDVFYKHVLHNLKGRQ